MTGKGTAGMGSVSGRARVWEIPSLIGREGYLDSGSDCTGT